MKETEQAPEEGWQAGNVCVQLRGCSRVKERSVQSPEQMVQPRQQREWRTELRPWKNRQLTDFAAVGHLDVRLVILADV